MEIAVVAEDLPDKIIACELADRVILAESPAWLDMEQLEFERTWRGLESGSQFTKWSTLNSLARRQRVRVLGHNPEELGGFDYSAARKAIALCSLDETNPLKVLLLVRDMDRQPAERRNSLLEARAHAAESPPLVVLALPNPMREAWVLNGFRPRTEREGRVLAAIAERLGFDPCGRAEALTGRRDHPKNPKLVLAELTDDDREREEVCWKESDLKIITDRGKFTGLADFLAEVRTLLVPKIVAKRP